MPTSTSADRTIPFQGGKLTLDEVRQRITKHRLPLHEALHLEAIPPLPAQVNWATNVTNLGEMGNDQFNDCQIASMGHIVQTWTAAMGHQKIIPTPILTQLYTALAQPTPQNPNPDLTAKPVFDYWLAQGVAGDRLVAGRTFDYKNQTAIRECIAYLGACHVIAKLTPQAWSTPGQLWDVQPGANTSPQFVVCQLNGHAFPLVGYDNNHAYAISYGVIQPITWRYLSVYCLEVWALLNTDWLGANGLSGSGLDQNHLQHIYNSLSDDPGVNVSCP